jgi:(p)ppGpp synthase/HD superfamily hydrolase
MAGSDIGEGPVPGFIGDSGLLDRAFELAARAHSGQRRRDGGPLLDHPVEVARRLHEAGFPEPVLAAGLLHDVVEDADVRIGEVVEAFGIEVGELVAALTEDPSIEDWGARKRALREQVAAAGRDATAIYVADKISNVGDLGRLYTRIGERAGEQYAVPLDQRIGIWREDMAMAQRSAPELDSVGELGAELDALERQRARAIAGTASG